MTQEQTQVPATLRDFPIIKSILEKEGYTVIFSNGNIQINKTLIKLTEDKK